MDQINQQSCKNTESHLINLNNSDKNLRNSNKQNSHIISNKSDEIQEDDEKDNSQNLKRNIQLKVPNLKKRENIDKCNQQKTFKIEERSFIFEKNELSQIQNDDYIVFSIENNDFTNQKSDQKYNINSLQKENMPQIHETPIIAKSTKNTKNNFQDYSQEQLTQKIQRLKDKLNKKEMIKNQYDNKIKSNQYLSEKILEAHIKQSHPHEVDIDDEEIVSKWSITKNVGSVFDFFCCKKTKISEFNKNIGIGSSLFLLSLKSYIFLFIILSILSIPACIVLSSGTEVNSENLSGNLWGLLSRASLGNIGYKKSYSCDHINIASMQTQLNLQCPYGKIKKIVSVGLNKNQEQSICGNDYALRSAGIKMDNQSVKIIGPINQITVMQTAINNSDIIIQNYIDFDKQCNSYLSSSFQNSAAVRNLEKEFNYKCRDQKQCNLNFDYLQLDDPECVDEILKRVYASKNIDFYNENHSFAMNKAKFDIRQPYNFNSQIPEPLLFVIAECDNQNLKIFGINIEFSKNDLVLFLVISDMILISAMLLGYQIICRIQKQFSQEFDKKIIQPNDFTLVIDNFPQSFSQYSDEISLKNAIFLQMKNIFGEIEKKDENKNQSIDYSIIQINILYSQNQGVQKQIELQNTFLMFQDLHSQICKYGKIYNEKQLDEKLQQFQKCKSQIITSLNQIQQIDQKFQIQNVEINDDLLKSISQKSKNFIKNIDRIYVTFQSMQTKRLVEEYFIQNFYMNPFSKIQIQQQLIEQSEQISLDPILILNNQQNQLDQSTTEYLYWENLKENKNSKINLKPVQILPQNILWQNLECSKLDKFARKFSIVLSIGLTFLAIIFALYGFTSSFIQSYFKSSDIIINGQQQKFQFKDESYDCLSNYTIQDVFEDIKLLPQYQDSEIINCYCRQQFQILDFNDFYQIDFNQIQSNSTSQTHFPKYCNIWFQELLIEKAQTFGPLIIVLVIVNFLGIPSSYVVAQIMKVTSSNSNQFIIFVQNYINIFFNFAITMTFLMQNPKDDIRQIIDYKKINFDFTNQWFLNVNSSIFIAISLQLIFYFLFQLSKYVSFNLKLFWHRSLLHSQEVQKELTQNNSKQRLIQEQKISQKQLNNLHLGGKFEGGLMQSQIISIISLCIMYSGCLPLLYFISLIFLVLFYWVNKFMLIKFNRHCLEFNQSLIIDSYSFLIIAFVSHFILTLFAMRDSPMLIQVEYPSENFQNEDSGENVINKLYIPPESNLYALYIITVAVIYVILAFIFTPLINLYKKGFCFTRSSKNSQLFQMKNDIEKQTKDNITENFEQINNLNIEKRGNKSLNGIEISFVQPQYRTSNYSKKDKQMDQFTKLQTNIQILKDNFAVKKNYKIYRTKSSNYFNEVTFNTLQFCLKDCSNQLIQLKKRLNLFQRIAHINKNSILYKIFNQKFEDLQQYHSEIIKTKQNIEKVVDFYWDFIEKNIDPNANNSLTDFLDESYLQKSKYYKNTLQKLRNSYKDQKSELRIIVELTEEDCVNQSSHIINSFEDQIEDSQFMFDHMNIDIDVMQQKEQDVQYIKKQDFNKFINNLIAQNGNNIQLKDLKDEMKERDSIEERIAKLEYLKNTYEENWLKTNFFPNRFRCTSMQYGQQTFNIFDSQQYSELKDVILMAKIVVPEIQIDQLASSIKKNDTQGK